MTRKNNNNTGRGKTKIGKTLINFRFSFPVTFLNSKGRKKNQNMQKEIQKVRRAMRNFSRHNLLFPIFFSYNFLDSQRTGKRKGQKKNTSTYATVRKDLGKP